MHSKRSDVQILRALAVLLVIVFHLELFENSGYIGVDVFFVISGYVITGSLLRRGSEQGTIRAAMQFVARRFVRLTPALLVMLVVTILLSTVFLSPYDLLPTAIITALAALFGLGNIAVALQSGDYFALAAESNPLLHTWSLGVEEQFYALMALLLALGIVARYDRIRLSAIVVALVFFTSLAAFAAGSSGYAIEGWQTAFGFYSPIARSWEIAAGVLMALGGTERYLTSLGHRSRSFLATSSMGGLLLLASFPDNYGELRGVITFAAVALACCVIGFGIREEHLTNRFAKPLISLGNFSYSVYLWHWPIILFVPFVIEPRLTQIVVSIGLIAISSWLSGRYIEFSWSAGSNRSSTVHRWVLFAALGGLSSIAMGYLSWSFPYPAPKFANEQGDLSASIPCKSIEDLATCYFDLGHKDELLIVGDSTALPYFEPALAYARVNSLNLRFSSQNGCPAGRPGIRYPRIQPCLGWQQSVHDFVNLAQPAEIWIINRGGAYTSPALGFYGILDERGKLLSDTSRIQLAWRDSLASLISQSEDSKFTIFHNGPELVKHSDERTLFNGLAGFEDAESDFDVGATIERRSVASAAEKSLISQNVRVLDPIDSLCNQSKCPFASQSGEGFYWDGSHLSPAGAMHVLSRIDDLQW